MKSDTIPAPPSFDVEFPPTVRVKKLHAAVSMPEYKTLGAAGVDLHASGRAVIPAGCTTVIQTGLAMEIPQGWEGQVRGRSGLSKDGILVHLGTVDSDYRGEVGVIVTNLGMRSHVVRPGDRIAQVIFARAEQADLVEADELSETQRGAGGFGSTGR